jgi:hypothetical protein
MVTRRSIHVNRTATAWLIRRFHDPDIVARASFLYDSLSAHLQRSGRVGASGSNHA